MKVFWLFVCVSLLSACVSFQPIIPDGYTGKVFTVNDTFTNHKKSKAHFFVLSKVDGTLIEDSGYATRVANNGHGFDMKPLMVSREITAEPHILTIQGYVHFATDGQAMFGRSMLVTKEIHLTPKPHETYKVKGVLDKSGSKVWLEDSEGNIYGESAELNKVL